MIGTAARSSLKDIRLSPPPAPLRRPRPRPRRRPLHQNAARPSHASICSSSTISGPELFDADQRRDLLEIVEDRYEARSIIITSQLPVDRRYEIIGNSTIADAILDRLVHNAYRIQLKGESLRKKKQLGLRSTCRSALPFGTLLCNGSRCDRLGYRFHLHHKRRSDLVLTRLGKVIFWHHASRLQVGKEAPNPNDYWLPKDAECRMRSGSRGAMFPQPVGGHEMRDTQMLEARLRGSSMLSAVASCGASIGCSRQAETADGWL